MPTGFMGQDWQDMVSIIVTNTSCKTLQTSTELISATLWVLPSSEVQSLSEWTYKAQPTTGMVLSTEVYQAILSINTSIYLVTLGKESNWNTKSVFASDFEGKKCCRKFSSTCFSVFICQCLSPYFFTFHRHWQNRVCRRKGRMYCSEI